MKKILASLAVIAVVASASVGATKAYFTSDASISNETFSSGTVTLNINGDDTYQNGSNRTVVQDSFANLKPGDTMRQWVTLHNAGSLDIGQLTIQANPVTDPSGLLGQILVQVIGYDNSPINAYYTPGLWTAGSPIDPWLSTPKDILSPGAVVYSPGIVPGKILAGQDDLIVLDFTVPTTMGDTFQGKSESFNLVFHAEQVH